MSTHGTGINIPVYNHIFVVWMENKSYSSIVNNREAPFMNSLMQDGTLFTNYREINDPSHIDKSQPNYIAVFAGIKTWY